MAIFSRKLLNQTIIDPSPALLCANYCNELHNPEGICPLICMDSCFQICKIVENLIPPPIEPYDETIYDHPAKKSHVGLSLFLTISISVLATVFFLLTCYTIYKLYSNWCKSRHRRRLLSRGSEQSVDDDFVVVDEDRGPEIDHPIWYIRTVGLQPSIVSAITVVKYKKGDGLVEGTDCSVCLSEFREDEMLRLLPKCNHAFHVPCIDTWLRSHTNCPMCRAGIVSQAAVLPVQEVVVVESSGVVAEENRGGESERREEVVRELGIEEDDVDDDLREEGKIQTMRRSVSVDFLSVSVTNAGVRLNRNSDNQLSEVRESGVGVFEERVDVNQLVGSSSNERPSYVKRSLSCSAKV